MIQGLRVAFQVFTKVRGALIRKGISRRGATVAAMGARGGLNAICRSAATDAFVSYFGREIPSEFKSEADSLISAISDVAQRVVQTFYNEIEEDGEGFNERSFRDRVDSAVEESLVSFARSRITDYLFRAFASKHGVKGTAYTVLKEYAFSAIDVAFRNVSEQVDSISREA